MDFLVFRLYGAMASWGEIAVGEARNSATYPSKSAIVGLLAAALGIRREDDDTHSALAQCYWQAVKLVKSGSVLKDYHTAQAPDSVGKFRYRTRRDELVHGKDRLGTVLSSREYRTDAQAIVAIIARENAPYSLNELQHALRSPKFHLYLGRKSCPLAAPLDAQIIAANGFREALDAYDAKPLLTNTPNWNSDSRWLPDDELTRYHWEGNIEMFSPYDATFVAQQVQTFSRHDLPASRQRWQFLPRQEYLWMQQKEAS